MLRGLTITDDVGATTILLVLLGIVFFAHGAQTMLGWFGGYGFSGTMGFFTGMMHIPAFLAFLANCAEFFGGLGLIFGLLTRVAAFGIAANMLVAVFNSTATSDSSPIGRAHKRAKVTNITYWYWRCVPFC